jgi:hypothetical protein
LLVGHVLACRWTHEDKKVCWIVPLVVHRDFRRRGLATELLHRLRDETSQEIVYCVLSSHPATIGAVLRAFGRGLEDVDLGVARDEVARGVLEKAPVRYVREARVKRSLFGEDGDGADGGVSSAFMGVWVDHGEVERALDVVEKDGRSWPFGVLEEGCEHLVIVR